MEFSCKYNTFSFCRNFHFWLLRHTRMPTRRASRWESSNITLYHKNYSLPVSTVELKFWVLIVFLGYEGKDERPCPKLGNASRPQRRIKINSPVTSISKDIRAVPWILACHWTKLQFCIQALVELPDCSNDL